MSDETVVETIVRAEVIQTALDQLTTIVSESVLRFSDEGITTAAVDPANAAMADLSIDAAALESVPDGSFVAGADLNTLDDYLSGASGDDPVSFSFDPETRRLTLRHTNREFKMSMIDPDSVRGEPDIPDDLELDTDLRLPGDAFADALDTAKLVVGKEGHVTLSADPDAGEFHVLGEGDIDEGRVTFDDDDLGDGTHLADTESIYSMPYLMGDSGLISGLPSGVGLQVRYDTEFPMKMSYEFADGNASVLLMLAPRIQAD